MSTSDEYRTLRAAARGDEPPDTEREFATPLDCTGLLCTPLPRPPSVPTIPRTRHGVEPDHRETPSGARKTDPQTPKSKSGEHRLKIDEILNDARKAAGLKAYESET